MPDLQVFCAALWSLHLLKAVELYIHPLLLRDVAHADSGAALGNDLQPDLLARHVRRAERNLYAHAVAIVAIQVITGRDAEIDLGGTVVEGSDGKPKRIPRIEKLCRIHRAGLHCEGNQENGDPAAHAQHPSLMKAAISAGEAKTTCARSPSMPCPTMTGAFGAGPLALESVLKRRLNSQYGTVSPAALVTKYESLQCRIAVTRLSGGASFRLGSARGLPASGLPGCDAFCRKAMRSALARSSLIPEKDM